MASDVYLQLKIGGEGPVTRMDEKLTWVPASKAEATYTLAKDTSQEIDIARFSNIKALLFVSASEYKISFTKTTPAAEENDPPEVVDVELNVTGFFLLSPTTETLDMLSNLKIHQVGNNAQRIEVRIYEETPAI